MYIIMSETSIKIDLLQHLEISISGRLRTNIVKGFQIHVPGMCFISSIMSKFLWHAFHGQQRQPISPEQRTFPVIFIATIRQIFCLSRLMLMHTRCQLCPSWIPFEHFNFSWRWQPHSPIKPDWSDLRDMNFDYTQGRGGGGGGNSIVFHPSFLTHSACQYDVTQ